MCTTTTTTTTTSTSTDPFIIADVDPHLSSQELYGSNGDNPMLQDVTKQHQQDIDAMCGTDTVLKKIVLSFLFSNRA
jgi:hypothetical protein